MHPTDTDAPLPYSWLWLGLIMLLAAGMLLFRLDHPAFWVDEAYAAVHVRQDFTSLIDLANTEERNPPGYYILLWGWTQIFGEGRVVWRSLSVVLGLACLPVLFVLLRPSLGTRVALLSVALLVLFPGFIHYARETRMYAAVFLCAMLAYLAFHRLSLACHPDSPKSPPLGWACLFVLALTFSVYAHFAAVALFFAFAFLTVVLAWQDKSRRLFWTGTLCLGLATALVIPLIIGLNRFISTQDSVAWIQPTSLKGLYDVITGAFPFPIWGKVLVFALYLYGFVCVWRRDRRMAWIILSGAVGILALAGIGLVRPVLLVRTIQPLTLLSPVLLAMALMHLPRKLGWVLALPVLAAHGLAFAKDYPTTRLPIPAEGFQPILAPIDATQDHVFYPVHLRREMRLMHLAPTGAYTELHLDQLDSQGPAIEAHIARCTLPARNSCGRTILIVEQAPPFDPENGARWRAFAQTVTQDLPGLTYHDILGHAVFILPATAP